MRYPGNSTVIVKLFAEGKSYYEVKSLTGESERTILTILRRFCPKANVREWNKYAKEHTEVAQLVKNRRRGRNERKKLDR